MVKEIHGKFDHSGYGGGDPLIQIHHTKRNVFGDGIGIKVWGELKIAAGEVVFAKELGLNTIQTLDLTPETGDTTQGYMAHKYIHHKGEYDNYGSIEIFTDDGTRQTAGTGPADGSVWLDVVALGE